MEGSPSEFLTPTLRGWRVLSSVFGRPPWPFTKIQSSSVYIWLPLFPIYGPGDAKRLEEVLGGVLNRWHEQQHFPDAVPF